MLKGANKLLLSILIVMCTVTVSFAEKDSEIEIYNTRLVTNDVDATYIEGNVNNQLGKSIFIFDGHEIIATKALPDVKGSISFKIKIPSNNIDKERVNVFHVKLSKSPTLLPLGGERVEITYKERNTQQIRTEKKKIELTLPGEEQSIQAKASSGGKLIFSSSDSKIVKVRDDGTLIPKGEGTAKVTVTQIGDSRFEGAEETINVAVKEIDAYMVTFHSSAEEDETNLQVIPSGKTEMLNENVFENGDHRFLGWATEEGGLVKYKDAEEVQDIAAKGAKTDLYAVWTGDGAAAAVAWAIEIANDDSFSYGAKPAANAIGCYFCGTNCGPVRHNKPKGYEKTYVCLTFVGAAYAHGAEDPEILAADRNGKMPLYENDDNFRKFSCWTKIGKCNSLDISDLEPGDVVIQWSDYNDNNGHTWIYAGDDLIVESTGGGWDAGSIALKEGASRRLVSYGRNERNYVMRYTGANAEN